MYKMTIQVPGGTMEVPGDSLEAVIKAASFLQNLPFVCPVDGTPTRLNYRKAGGFDYYGLVSTGSPVYTYPFGRPLEKGDGEFFEGKFVKQGKEGETRRQWCYYDHSKQEQIVVWEDGKLLVKVPQGGKPADKEAIAQHSNGSDELVQWAENALPTLPKKEVGVYESPLAQELKAKRATLDALGRGIFKERWAAVLTKNVGKITEGAESDVARLTPGELDQLIAGMQKLQAGVGV